MDFMRFIVLSSGSRGNCCILIHEHQGIILDLGIGPRTLESSLKNHHLDLSRIRAAVISHTHGDHWHEKSLQLLLKHRIKLFVHATHEDQLLRESKNFRLLKQWGCVAVYCPTRDFSPLDGWDWTAHEISHDSEKTFGFRIRLNSGHASYQVGYLADLGTWDEHLADEFHDLDLLALEFNHDENLQRNSSRPGFLIERIMGNQGHLSNHQAALFLRHLGNANALPRHLLQVHLSEQCNTMEHARQAAKAILEQHRAPTEIHTAHGRKALPVIDLFQRDLFSCTKELGGY